MRGLDSDLEEPSGEEGDWCHVTGQGYWGLRDQDEAEETISYREKNDHSQGPTRGDNKDITKSSALREAKTAPNALFFERFII